MASSGNMWSQEEEEAVSHTFRQVADDLPLVMLEMPKDPSRKWAHIKDIAKRMHPHLPRWVRDSRTIDAIKFRVILAWYGLADEQVQKLTAENGSLKSDVVRMSHEKGGLERELAHEVERREEAGNYARAREEEERAREEERRRTSHEKEGLERELAREVNRREEAEHHARVREEEGRAREEEDKKLLFESGTMMFKMWSHLNAKALQDYPAPNNAEIHLGYPQPSVKDIEMRPSHSANVDVHIGMAWCMPIARVAPLSLPASPSSTAPAENIDFETPPKKRRIAMLEVLGPDDPEI